MVYPLTPPKSVVCGEFFSPASDWSLVMPRFFLMFGIMQDQPQVLTMFPFYAAFSVTGWILVGIPIALVFPARLVTRMAWPIRIVIGASLGPLALLVILLLIAAHQRTLSTFSLAHSDGILWSFSMLVSAVSFDVYAALLRRRLSK